MYYNTINKKKTNTCNQTHRLYTQWRKCCGLQHFIYTSPPSSLSKTTESSSENKNMCTSVGFVCSGQLWRHGSTTRRDEMDHDKQSTTYVDMKSSFLAHGKQLFLVSGRFTQMETWSRVVNPAGRSLNHEVGSDWKWQRWVAPRNEHAVN